MNWLYGLNDARDHWWGDDKQAHLFGAAFATCAFGWPLAIIASIAIEVIEVVRWYRLGPTKRDMVDSGVLPWPAMTDRVSPKDLIVDALGIGLALVIT